MRPEVTASGASRKPVVVAFAAAAAVVGLGVSFALLWPGPEPGERVELADAAEPPASFARAPPWDEPLSSSGRPGPRPLWRVVDAASVTAIPPYPASWSEAGRVLVDVTAAASSADAWRVGDRLAVELPQLGGVHEWTVERIDEGLDARSRSVRGWIDNGGDRRRRIVVTVGPGRVLAYIDTTRGPYELTGNARLAWLLPSSSMMAGIDFSKPDYFLPDRRGSDRETP